MVEAASCADLSLILPSIALASPVAMVEPIPARKTLATERFIAFAINSVSSEPAEPTTSVRAGSGLDHEEANKFAEPIEERSIPEGPEFAQTPVAAIP